MTPVRIPLKLIEGNAFARTLTWTDDLGSVLWSSAAKHRVNDVVRAFPDIIDVYGNRMYFRATTVFGLGISAASQPAFSTLSIGQTISDNQVTWTAQADSTFPVDVSAVGTSATLIVRPSPDSAEAPVLTLSSGSGTIVLAGAGVSSIAFSFTTSQIAKLLSALRYAYYDLRVTFPNGTPQTVCFGPIEFQRMAVRS